jgi:ABC-type nitrate/sulfonate/bicarbonate transport system permease component
MSESASRPGPVFGLLGWLIALLFVGGVLIVWAVVAASGGALIVPDPGKAFARLGAMLGEPAVQSAILATLASWAVAFVLGAALGLAIGIPAGRTRIGGALLAPLAFVASTLPAAVLALLFVLFDGIGGASAYIVPGMIAAFIPAAAVSARAQAGGPAERWRGAFHALEAAAVAALTAVVLIEMIAGKDRIGALAATAFSTFDAPAMYALIILLWLAGMAVALPFALGRWLAGRAR